ncbi:MAG: PKD domain-containing protein [Bacteroidales bacterium]|nr:PKD domain-containing protein [Bacteroidales bacterium]
MCALMIEALSNPNTYLETALKDACFSSAQQSGSLTVNFDASCSTPGDGASITGYSWNFGDGSTGSGQTTSHTYASAGNYSVALTIQTNNSGSDVQTSTVAVTPPSDNGVGLFGEYYNDKTLSALDFTRVDPTVNFNWSGRPAAILGSTISRFAGADK